MIRLFVSHIQNSPPNPICVVFTWVKCLLLYCIFKMETMLKRNKMQSMRNHSPGGSLRAGHRANSPAVNET